MKLILLLLLLIPAAGYCQLQNSALALHEKDSAALVLPLLNGPLLLDEELLYSLGEGDAISMDAAKKIHIGTIELSPAGKILAYRFIDKKRAAVQIGDWKAEDSRLVLELDYIVLVLSQSKAKDRLYEYVVNSLICR